MTSCVCFVCAVLKVTLITVRSCAVSHDEVAVTTIAW